MASSDSNGLSYGSAMYTAPFRGDSSRGVSISTVPTFELSGQAGGLPAKWIGLEPSGVVSPTSAEEQPVRPWAPAVFTAIPSGSLIVISFRWEVARPHSTGGPASHR